MKVTPIGPYILCKKYVKPKQKSALILANEPENKNWGIAIKGPYAEGSILQVKPYSQMYIDGSEDLFLVRDEDVIAMIEV